MGTVLLVSFLMGSCLFSARLVTAQTAGDGILTVSEFTDVEIGEQILILRNIAEQMITAYRSDVFWSGKYEGL